MKRNYVLKVLFAILFVGTAWQNSLAQVTLVEEDWVLPTYEVTKDNNPQFYKGEGHQGGAKHIYPYALNDVIAQESVDKPLKTIVLENEYIKLVMAPEIGGKLYYATDKTSNYNFIYKNNVIKPSNIGMLGAWVSGGIEWCVLHHHRASTFLPVDCDFRENEDGSKTVWVGESEPRHGMRWTVGITLTPGKSYFQAEVKIVNSTPFTHTFLYWANVAAHTNRDYQTIFPPSVDFAMYHSKNSFTRWPVSDGMYTGRDFSGVDVSWWKNVEQSNSFFAYDKKEDFMGGYDHGKDRGTVHIADHNIVKGAKVWEWGSGPRGQATESRLTLNDGPYVEIMVGAYSDNQPDYSWIRPYEVKTFKQYWYPVKDIQGFKNANLNGAVNLEPRGKNAVFLGYYSTQKIEKAKISLKNGETVVFQKVVEISPEKAFTTTVKIQEDYRLTDLYTEMVDESTGEILVSYQHKDKILKDIPDVVKPPASPKDIATIEELFMAGSRLEQFHNNWSTQMDYYNEILSRDPGDIRTNTAVGNIYLKNFDYANAQKYFCKAIERLTKNYTRPASCEAFYLEGLTLKALKRYDDAIDTLYRAVWDLAYYSSAYYELAGISCILGDYKKALEQVNESLVTNMRNTSAITLKATILRKLGDYNGAIETLKALSNDPLDFWACNERYLNLKERGDSQKAQQELASLVKKMRNFDQNYIELAVKYINNGFLADAEDVLLRYRGSFPIVSYYLGYLQNAKGNKTGAADCFNKGSAQSTDLCFPYRINTYNVLDVALQYNPNDAKALYYQGNIMYEKQPELAVDKWEAAVKIDPTFAVAQRNLGWAYYHIEDNGAKAISAYEKALAYEKNEPVFFEELDELYEKNNSPIETRLALFAGNNEVVKKRDNAFVREITVLTLAGQSDKAVEYLGNRHFSYREGDSRVRETLINAQLMLGRKYYAGGNYNAALKYFLAARVPDEEAGSERAGNKNLQVYYYIGTAYEALGNKRKSKEYYTMVVNQGRDNRLAIGQVSSDGATRARNMNIYDYYVGLSQAKLGNITGSNEIFNALISSGTNQLSKNSNVDFFAKFGEQESENARLSQAYLLVGVGYKGLGNKTKALENLTTAVKLSNGNLWAKAELDELSNK